MRTIPQPCNSRKLVLTFERATDNVVEISSAGSGLAAKYKSACTCATVRLIPHFVPISPQCKMNFSSTGAKPLDFEFTCSVIYHLIHFAAYATAQPNRSLLQSSTEIQMRSLRSAGVRAPRACSSISVRFPFAREGHQFPACVLSLVDRCEFPRPPAISSRTHNSSQDLVTPHSPRHRSSCPQSEIPPLARNPLHGSTRRIVSPTRAGRPVQSAPIEAVRRTRLRDLDSLSSNSEAQFFGSSPYSPQKTSPPNAWQPQC